MSNASEFLEAHLPKVSRKDMGPAKMLWYTSVKAGAVTSTEKKVQFAQAVLWLDHRRRLLFDRHYRGRRLSEYFVHIHEADGA